MLTATHTTLLARLANAKDDAAWSEFHARYGDLIRGFCRRRGLQPADIEDVEQDVLLSLTKVMPGFVYDPSKGLFRSYLKTVVVNAISRRFRQNSASDGLSRFESDIPAADDEDQWESEWRQYHMRTALKRIAAEFSDSDRQAFDLYAVNGLDANETAKKLGISIDSVYQAKSRIVRRLGEIIEMQVSQEG